jgi:hypothetical protein
MRAPEFRSPGPRVPVRGSAGEGAGVVPPRRILLLRSGRHLRVAMDALAVRYPGCHIGVVGTPGSQTALQQAGFAESDTFLHDRPRFLPAAFFFSRTALAVRRWRYDHVAILWNDPDGKGQGNVDRTALAMSPDGYLAVTPDGSIVERALWPQLRTEALRILASVVVGAVLGVFLYAPALAMKFVRQLWRPMKGRPAAADVPSGNPGSKESHDGRAALHGPPAGSHAVVLPFKRPEARR